MISLIRKNVRDLLTTEEFCEQDFLSEMHLLSVQIASYKNLIFDKNAGGQISYPTSKRG